MSSINVLVKRDAKRGISISNISYKQDTRLCVFDWSCWKDYFIWKVKNSTSSNCTNWNHELLSLSDTHQFMDVILAWNKSIASLHTTDMLSQWRHNKDWSHANLSSIAIWNNDRLRLMHANEMWNKLDAKKLNVTVQQCMVDR